MKPRSKNDSWCHTASTRQTRKKIRRLTNKRHRREDERIIRREAETGLPYPYIRTLRRAVRCTHILVDADADSELVEAAKAWYIKAIQNLIKARRV
jgi:hypothetical protein